MTLALQGGGSHGAFTWGVLDRLLEEERLEIEGISGTSAGALNAVALAHGLTSAGRAGARAALAELWQRIAKLPFSLPPSDLFEPLGGTPSPALKAFLSLTRIFSPYQLNPFDINPLRHIISELIDFERIRAECKLKLFVAATQVRTGQLRLFETAELSANALLASACLPALHHAIEIDGEAYWDGGYSGNPTILPLLYDCRSPDVVAVLLHPFRRPAIPIKADDIWSRVAELGFSTHFLCEMQAVVKAKQHISKVLFWLSRFEHRIRRLNFHLIEAEELMGSLSLLSRFNTHAAFLEMLRDAGRRRADLWLQQNFSALGRRSSAGLAELFC